MVRPAGSQVKIQVKTACSAIRPPAMPGQCTLQPRPGSPRTCHDRRSESGMQPIKVHCIQVRPFGAGRANAHRLILSLAANIPSN
jgi:hypothetical protein